jgi:hypothetical protein
MKKIEKINERVVNQFSWQVDEQVYLQAREGVRREIHAQVYLQAHEGVRREIHARLDHDQVHLQVYAQIINNMK